MNLSAYAASIHSEVERRARKQVKQGTIVVALSRISQEQYAPKQKPLLPDVVIDHLAVKTGIVEFCFDRTRVNKERIQKLYHHSDFANADLFYAVQGVSEISLLASQNLKKAINKAFDKERPKFFRDKLVCLSVRFDEKYIEVPNVVYVFIREFALRRINVIEIVSTFSELSFILDEDDLQEAFMLLSSLQKNAR